MYGWKGSGKDGRVLKGDLINLMGISPPPSERKIKHGHEERIKMTRLRQTIAKRLKQAQENAALLTTFNEVDPVIKNMSVDEIKKIIEKNSSGMNKAADKLDFYEAARLRDENIELQKILENKS